MARRSKLILPPKAPPPARPDGRPLYYDLAGVTDRAMCYRCVQMGVGAFYGRGTAYMNDPANSPVLTPQGWSDGGCYFLCKGHTPEDAVIYDPVTGECHDKNGTNVWREDTSMPGPNGT